FPAVGGGLTFEKAWSAPQISGGNLAACGPLLGLNGEGKALHPCLERPRGEINPRVDVDVDQSNGHIFYLRTVSGLQGEKQVVEFDALGEGEITRFGEQAA